MGVNHHAISRRRLALGVAWATPTVLYATSAPALAASTIEALCKPRVEEASADWDVDGVTFSGCKRYACHKDVQLQFTLSSQCTATVVVEVQPIAGAAVWCAWSGTQIASKTLTAGGSVTFPAPGDNYGSCTHTAYPSANDGIHINPCFEGPQVKYRFTIAGVQGLWTSLTISPPTC